MREGGRRWLFERMGGDSQRRQQSINRLVGSEYLIACLIFKGETVIDWLIDIYFWY
jgi:hypothetical protein